MLQQIEDVGKACRDGNINALRDALRNLSSNDINLPNEEGLCPIHISILYNDGITAQRLLEELIKEGANVNVVDKRSGDSVLHLCLSFKTSNISKRLIPFLMKKGCNGFNANYAGKSAIDVAKDNGYFDLEQYIRDFPKLKHVFDYSIPQKESKIELSSVDEEPTEVVNPTKNVSLVKYIKMNDLQSIKMLLEEGADVNFNDQSTYLPIHYAVSKGISDPISVLKLLQSYNAQMDLKTEENDSILTLAIKKIEDEELCLKVVEFLKSCGISTFEKDNDGNDAVTLARLRHFYSVINILTNVHEFEGSNHPIHNICRNQSLGMERKLIALENPYFKNNVSVNLQTKLENETCLHIACRNNEEEIVKYLLLKNATVNVFNKDGETPLSITREITKNATIEYMLVEADKRQNPHVEQNVSKNEVIKKEVTKKKVIENEEIKSIKVKEKKLQSKGCNIL